MSTPPDALIAPPPAGRLGEFRLKVEKTLRHHTGRALVAWREALWNLAPRPADRPVFVVSGSRSGTQMLYKTLSLSPDIGTLNREIYAVWSRLHSPADKSWESHMLTREDASAADRDFLTRYFYARTGHRRFVDKNNQHGLAVPYLHALFPDARFVYIKRNPGDTLNSMIEAWGRPERYATWSKALPALVEVDRGRYTRWCHFLPKDWRDYLHAPIEEVCAFQYASIHGAIRRAARDIAPEQWLEVFYEDIVAHPVATNERIYHHCGLPFRREIKAQCSTLLERPYDAFSEIRVHKWRDKPYRERIERVLPSLAGLAAEMGYRL